MKYWLLKCTDNIPQHAFIIERLFNDNIHLAAKPCPPNFRHLKFSNTYALLSAFIGFLTTEALSAREKNLFVTFSLTGNTTALFSIDQDLCGRSPTVSQIKGTSVPNSTIDAKVTPTTTAIAVGLGTENGTSFPSTTQSQSKNSTQAMYQSTSHHPPESTMAPVAAEYSRRKSQTSANPAVDAQTTIIHRTPTKRFVPPGMMRISSTSTASTRLIMSNLPESDESSALGPLNKGNAACFCHHGYRPEPKGLEFRRAELLSEYK